MTWIRRLLARFDTWVDNLDVYAPSSRVRGTPPGDEPPGRTP